MGEERRIERNVPRHGLPGFLREVADAVEHARQGEMSGLGAARKFSVSARQEDGGYRVKVKIEDRESKEERGAERYKDLKKRMRDDFKAIVKTMRQGGTPERAMVERLVADGRRMTSWQGRGDEYYGEFTRALDELKAAYDAGDRGRMDAAAGELSRLKSRCHAEHA